MSCQGRISSLVVPMKFVLIVCAVGVTKMLKLDYYYENLVTVLSVSS